MTAHLLLALVAMAAVDIDCAEYVKCNPTVNVVYNGGTGILRLQFTAT